MSDERTLEIGFELRLGGAIVPLASLTVREGMSTLIHGSAVVAVREALDVPPLVGSTATVTWLVKRAPVRTTTFVVGEIAFQEIEQGSHRYRVELHHPVWLLRHTRGTRKFRNLSASDIITRVLTEAGVSFSWSISRQPPVRKYCLQYRESHHDFVCRLLEHEGIYFLANQDGTLSLEDTSSAVDVVDGEPAFRLLGNQAALQSGKMGVHAFGWGSRVGVGKVTVNDYNWKTPDVSLLATAVGDADDELELYDYPTGFRKPSQGAEFSQMRLESVRARTTFATGESDVVFFMPGRRATIEHREWLLVDVTHDYVDHAFEEEGTGGASYINRFEAIPADVPFRPPVITPQPSIDGCHTAMVRGPEGEEIHTDRWGRFKAQFHWDREATGTDADSRWLRKLQEGATSINLARVGWEVSVAYIDGDPDRPVGLARNINGAMLPAYTQPANKPVMTIKTPTYPGKVGFNELKLDDQSGAQRFDIRAELDLINRVNHDKTETVGNNQTHVVDRQLKHRVERDQTLEVGGNQDIDTASNFKMDVRQNRAVSIGGDQRLDIAGSFQVDVGASQTERVGSLRLSIVGSVTPPDIAANARAMVPNASDAAKSTGKAALQGARGGGEAAGAKAGAKANLQQMVPTPQGAASQLTGGLSSGNFMSLAKGAIDRTATDTLQRTVGAIHLAVAGDDINVNAQKLHAEVIGGAKITAAKTGIAQTAGKLMALTVGAAMFKQAAEDAGYGAKVSKVMVGGMAKLSGDTKIELSGKEIRLEAATRLELRSGGLGLVLTPGSASIEGSIRLEATERITVTGRDDNLTKAS